MKKFFLILALSVFVVTLSGCASENTAGKTEIALEQGQPDIFLEGDMTDNQPLTAPPDIVISGDNGEIATAVICKASAYSWSYTDGELIESALADGKSPAEMLDDSAASVLQHSSANGTVSVQLPVGASISSVSRWTREQTLSAEYSGSTIILAEDGEEYAYELVVEYPEDKNPNGYGTARYCFIVR